jgi:glycosyltransferase involved in cell wall biosynthesis
MGPTSSSAGELHIGMVAPPWYSVPPDAYGGIEEVVANLTRVLVERGHRVTLIGAGEDDTPATFHRTYEQPPSERLGEPVPEVLHAAAAAQLLADLDVDLVHDHSLAGPLTAAGRSEPTVVTMHGPVGGEMADYFRRLGETISLVAISDAQRELAPDMNWVATVHNGIDVDSFPFQEHKEDWLLFVGRFSPDKGAHLAIDAARAAGRYIVLAGKASEPNEKQYFEQEIRHRLGDDATYIGELDASAKRDLYAKAACLLFPIRWPEPFGMVMIEAMACGTPVIAFPFGSVPEVIEDGRTGFIVRDEDAAVKALARLDHLERTQIRRSFERRFSARRMATEYIQLYESLLAERRQRAAPRRLDDELENA